MQSTEAVVSRQAQAVADASRPEAGVRAAQAAPRLGQQPAPAAARRTLSPAAVPAGRCASRAARAQQWGSRVSRVAGLACFSASMALCAHATVRQQTKAKIAPMKASPTTLADARWPGAALPCSATRPGLQATEKQRKQAPPSPRPPLWRSPAGRRCRRRQRRPRPQRWRPPRRASPPARAPPPPWPDPRGPSLQGGWAWSLY